MAQALDELEKDPETKNAVVPIFISCDPQRDSPEIVSTYIKEFHPKMVGFTGSVDQIAAVAKLFRVYFSAPPDLAEDEEYLVDHSIFIYLMDGKGEFEDCFGQNTTTGQLVDAVKKYIKKYKEKGGIVDQNEWSI